VADNGLDPPKARKLRESLQPVGMTDLREGIDFWSGIWDSMGFVGNQTKSRHDRKGKRAV